MTSTHQTRRSLRHDERSELASFSPRQQAAAPSWTLLKIRHMWRGRHIRGRQSPETRYSPKSTSRPLPASRCLGRNRSSGDCSSTGGPAKCIPGKRRLAPTGPSSASPGRCVPRSQTVSLPRAEPRCPWFVGCGRAAQLVSTRCTTYTGFREAADFPSCVYYPAGPRLSRLRVRCHTFPSCMRLP